MFQVLYNTGILLYTALVHLAAFFNVKKAVLWVKGRENWRERYQFKETGPVLWLHAASLGEFEQGRPVLEAIRQQFPHWQIVLTFFSPSGYEIRKNYTGADVILYLPTDTRENARDFLNFIKPNLVIFVKYEFWANYLGQIKAQGIPAFLISAVFRPGQPFFKFWGTFWRKMLNCFSAIYVQNQQSADLLRRIGYTDVIISGDTRIDRVLQIAASAPENEPVRSFAHECPVIVVGSSWPADEAVIVPAINHPKFQHFRWIIAPHIPSEAHLIALESRLSVPFIRYSNINAPVTAKIRVMIIDNIGLLNTLYRYGRIAYIGGGFGKSIHNTLEPAAFGLPVIFGPKYQRFDEARAFVSEKGAFPVKNSNDFNAVLKYLEHPGHYQTASKAVRAYLENSQGATSQVLKGLPL